MNRRALITGALSGLIATSSTATESPPVPKWKPSFAQAIDRIVDRFSYYFDRHVDFAVFKNGTCAIVETGATEQAATSSAIETLSKIFHYHPDMDPAPADDGNILVSYDYPAFNVVLSDIAAQHWSEITARHLDGLVEDEVLLTPQGQNVFDDFGKKALLGRCYMFMDAEAANVVRIVRRTA